MEAKTPLLQDKRMFVTVATVASLLVARYFGIQLEPELLATIGLTVIGWVTNSAMREAKVAGTVAAAKVDSKAAAVAVLAGEEVTKP